VNPQASAQNGKAASTAAPAWKRVLSLDNPYVVPAFITCILLVGHLSFGILESYPKTLLAIVVAIAVTRATSDALCTVAVISTLPAEAPRVTCVDATPSASVTAVVGVSVAVPVVTAKVTVTPDTGALAAVVTSNTTGDVSVLPTRPD